MAAMDDDFDDLMDDIDFDIDGGNKKSKPKNVVFATGLDTVEGIKESLNPMDKISTIVRELMPSAVRSEYSDLETAIQEIKEETDKGLENVTNSLKDVSKAISGLLPEGKIKEKLKEFGTRDNYNENYKSKEQEEKEKINQAIMEAMGEAQDQDRKATLVKEALEEQRQANAQTVLKHIYAELKANTHFNNRIAEKYYFKSLELQYKQLYKTSELVELTKVGWELNRKQMESIVINTSLPDIIRLKTLQAANDRRLAARAKTSYLGNYFKRFNPFENLTKNLKQNINQQFSMWNESLQAALMGADQAREFRQQMAEFGGISPATILGSQIGDFIRSRTLGGIGDRLGQTRQGRRFIFNFKDFMADPRYFLRNQRENIRGDGFMSRMARSALGTLSSLAGTPAKKHTEFINENLDDAKAFDGRVHQAIVKVIPGLLTDIRGILKASTKVGDEEMEANKVYFDNKTGRFVSGDTIRRDMRLDMRAAIDDDGFKYYAQQLLGQLENNGAAFTNKEKVKVARALATFMMDTGTTSVSPRILQDPKFHKLIGGNIKTKLIAAANGLIAQAYTDHYVMEDIKNQLEGMRQSLPNMNNRLQDLYRSGHMHLADGLVSQDRRTGNYTLNDRARDREIRRAILGIDFGSDGGISGVTDDEVASAVERTRAQVNEAVSELRNTSVGRRVEGIVGATRQRGTNIVNNIRNSRTGRNVGNAVRSVDERFGISSRIDRARGWMAEREGELIALLNQDDEAFKQTLMEKKASIESIMTWENFKNKPKEIQEKLRNKFKDMQNTYSGVMKDLKEKGKALSKMSIADIAQEAKDQAKEIYGRAEQEITRVTKDFMEDAKNAGVTPEKIEALKTKIKDIKKRADDEIKSRPRLHAAVTKAKSTASRASNAAKDRSQQAKDLGNRALNAARNTEIGRRAEERFNRIKSVSIESLKSFLTTDLESIKEALVEKKASIESLIPIEKLRTKSTELQQELASKFEQAQDAVSKAVKEARKNVDKIGKDNKLDGNAKEKALTICKETEDEITEICGDFVENATKTGTTPEKIDEFKRAIESSRKNMTDRLNNDPDAKPVKKKKMFRKTRALMGASWWLAKKAVKLGWWMSPGGFAQSLGKNIYGRALKRGWIKPTSESSILNFFKRKFGRGGQPSDMPELEETPLTRNQQQAQNEQPLPNEPSTPNIGASPITQPSAANADLQDQVDKAERQQIKDQLEQQRQGSAKNQFRERKRFLEANDGRRKRSGFLSKALAKPLMYGGLGLLGVMLLQKMGFGLEDLTGFVKGFVGVATTIASGVGKIAEGIGWVAEKIGSLLSLFGIGTDENGNNTGLGGKIMGGLAAGGLAYWGAKKLGITRAIGGGARLAGRTRAYTRRGLGRTRNRMTAMDRLNRIRSRNANALRGPGRLSRLGRLGLIGGGLLGAGSMLFGGEEESMAETAMDAVDTAGDIADLRNTPGSNQPGMFSRAKSWFGNKLTAGKNLLASGISKIPTPSAVKSAIVNIGKKAAEKFKPATAKAIAVAIGRKLGLRAAPAVAGAAVASTGVGAPIGAVLGAISLAMLAFDVYGIGRNLIDGKSLGSAVSEHYLGFDVFADETTEEVVNQNKEIIDAKIEVAAEEGKVKSNIAANKEAEKNIKNIDTNVDSSVETARRETNNKLDNIAANNPGNKNTHSYNNISSYSPEQDKISQELAKMPNKPLQSVPNNFVFEDITSVSGWFESGGKPNTISSGVGDFGGQSYGKHQMIKSTVEAYLKQSRFGRYFKGLTPATSAFNSRWMEVTSKFGKEFEDDQRAYIERSHYDPVVSKLQGMGLYLEGRSQALKSAVFSLGVSRGAGGAVRLIKNALNFYKLSPISASDKEIIEAIYNFEYATIDSSYRSSSPGIRNSRRNRSVEEKALVLSLLDQQPGKEQPKTIKEETTVASTNHENRNQLPSTLASGNKNNNFISTTTNTNTPTVKHETHSDGGHKSVATGRSLRKTYGRFAAYRALEPQIQEFINNSGYRDEFEGLELYSKEFNSKWGEITKRDGTAFDTLQLAYLRQGVDKLREVSKTARVNTPVPVTDPKFITDSKKNDMIQNVSYSPSIAKASEDMSSISNRTKGSVDTNTNSPTASQMMSILTQQLYVQNNMLKNLVQIATNTSVFSKFAEKQDKQNTEDNQPTMLPMPAVPLERKENFTMNI